MYLGVNANILRRGQPDVGLYAAIARKADELGFESLWASHHVVFSSEISNTYPYSVDGVSTQDPAGNRLDPWVLFGYLAGMTKRLRFGTHVYILPIVNPLVTARAVATADALSSGRMMFGIGVGWNEDEYRTLGAEFHTRGARADEIIEILRLLWTQESRIEFHGKHYSFGPVEFQPKPAQHPHPPMFYGGGNSPLYGTPEVVMRRAADVNGFMFGPGVSVEQMSEVIDDVKRRRQESGRADEPYEFTAIAKETMLSPDLLDSLEEVGIHRLLFEVGKSPFDQSQAWLPATAEALMDNLMDVADRLPNMLLAPEQL